MLTLITDQQMQVLEQYVAQHGVTERTLQEDLLDHMCCLVEEAILEGKTFTEAYTIVQQAFPAPDLHTIQQDQTYLLNHNPLTAMKRLFYWVLFLTIFFINTGSLFQLMHWPGAKAIMVSGFVVLLFGLLPITAYQAFRHAANHPPAVVARIAFGLLGGTLAASGWLFKTMHWPTASIQIMSGMLILNCIFLPLFMYQLYQRSRVTFA